MMRQRRLAGTTWGLAALLAALGAYVYLVEVRGGERQERAQEASAHLLPFRPESATELVIERPGDHIVCRKAQGRWRIVAPVRTAGDDGTISRLLSDVAAAHVERVVGDGGFRTPRPGGLASFGLARPLVLTIAAGGSRETIEVGKENPTGSFVFARRGTAAAPGSSGPVLLVERKLRDAAQKTLYDLREKSVLDFAPEDVQAILFAHRGQSVRLARDKPGAGPAQRGWQLVEPLRARADRGEIERSLDLLSSVRAEQFVNEESKHLERYDLSPPESRVRFDLKGGRSQCILIGGKTKAGALTRYFARLPGSGPVFTINENLPRDAQRTPQEWRERHATDFVRADVAEIRLISPRRTVVCAKTEGPNGDEWRLAEFTGPVAEGMNLGAAARMPAALRADRDRVSELIAHLATLEATVFLDGSTPNDPRFSLAQPELKVVALDKSGKPLASVSLGRRSSDSRYASSPHLGVVFKVRAADTDRFRVSSRDLAARP